jgi:hypothetical protein
VTRRELRDAVILGTELFTETATVNLNKGDFVHYLGSVNALDLNIFKNNSTLWVEITIGTDPPLSPRTELATAPFGAHSQHAVDATTVSGETVANLHAWANLTGVPAGFADGADADSLGALTSCANQDGIKWNGSAWVCAAAATWPTGMVMFYDGATCPVGWTELTAARGRYLVGLPSGGTLNGTAGTALTNLEDRASGQHTHTVTVTDPGHTHAVTDPGHTHTLTQGSANPASTSQIALSNRTVAGTTATASATTGLTVNSGTTGITASTAFPASSVAGTNAPYLQLLVCRKD